MESIHECSETTRARRDRQIWATCGACRAEPWWALRLPNRPAAIGDKSGRTTGLAGLSLVVPVRPDPLVSPRPLAVADMLNVKPSQVGWAGSRVHFLVPSR